MTADLVGKRLGDFLVVRELGRGGMGVVYEAVQASLNRRVALKVLGHGLGLTPKAVDRFRREAESAAKLHHTNIVSVYATGEQDGTHFYAMELILGPSLDHVIRERASQASPGPSAVPTVADRVALGSLAQTSPYDGPVPSAQAAAPVSVPAFGTAYFDTVARMVADVADALHHAHQQGVVHRDVKPSNLLLSPEGRLHVNDFGLARVLEQPGMTVTGEFVGTPAYMAPEQIASGRVPVDHRCDVYSLGATLYELLTLRPPFTADSRDRLLAMVLQKVPTPPQSVSPAVPRDLETICLKCLEKDPDRRYATAKELADDLRRYVNRLAIRARRTGPLGKLKKWVKRNPALTAAGALVLVAALTAGAFAYRAHLAERAVARERREKERKEALAAALDRAVVLAMSGEFPAARRAIDEAVALGASAGQVRLMHGQVELHQGNTARAIEHLEVAAQLLPDSVAARAVLLRAYYDAGLHERFHQHAGEIYRMPPVTAEDYLYKGQVLSFYYAPAEALALLDQSVALRDAPLARLIRAEVRTRFAEDTGSWPDAQRALADVREVRRLLPTSPVALTVALDANMQAAWVAEVNGLGDERAAAVAAADQIAADLAPVTTYPKAVRARVTYLDSRGRKEDVRRAYEADGSPGKANTRRVYFLELCRRGEFDAALKVLGDVRTWPGNEMRYHFWSGLVLACQGGNRALVRAEYQKAAEFGRRGRGSSGHLYPPVLLLLLGGPDRAAAVKTYQKSIKDGIDDPLDQARWREHLILYCSGGLSAQRLLARAAGSRWRLCEGHFFVGLMLLADGDRKAARKQFEACVATRVYYFMEHEWSRVFLARMAADDGWPAGAAKKR